MKKIIAMFSVFVVTGILYGLIEILFKGFVHNTWTTHYSMIVLAGFSSILIGLLNEKISWDIPVWKQAIIGGLIITMGELLTGLVFNLDFSIWNYSDMFMNFRGQICVVFSIAWIFISIPIIFLDDYLKYKFFDGDKLRYKWF